MWVNNFSEQARQEIVFERVRYYPSHFEPGCNMDSILNIFWEKKLKLYSDEECKNLIELEISDNPAFNTFLDLGE